MFFIFNLFRKKRKTTTPTTTTTAAATPAAKRGRVSSFSTPSTCTMPAGSGTTFAGERGGGSWIEGRGRGVVLLLLRVFSDLSPEFTANPSFRKTFFFWSAGVCALCVRARDSRYRSTHTRARARFLVCFFRDKKQAYFAHVNINQFSSPRNCDDMYIWLLSRLSIPAVDHDAYGLVQSKTMERCAPRENFFRKLFQFFQN